MMQLESILYSQGFGTRKECRTLIRSGRVSINGIICRDPFESFCEQSENDEIGLLFSVDDQEYHYRKNVYIILNKPKGYECSHKPSFYPSVFKLFPDSFVKRGLQCVGRLDQDTTGLLLFSDDGQFIHKWSSGKKKIPKCYEVTTKDPLSVQTIEHLLEGIQLKDEKLPVKAFNCLKKNEFFFEMTIFEGKYHQVKRMVSAAGNVVEKLNRKSVGGLMLDTSLAEGQWKWMNLNEHTALNNYASEK